MGVILTYWEFNISWFWFWCSWYSKGDYTSLFAFSLFWSLSFLYRPPPQFWSAIFSMSKKNHSSDFNRINTPESWCNTFMVSIVEIQHLFSSTLVLFWWVFDDTVNKDRCNLTCQDKLIGNYGNMGLGESKHTEWTTTLCFQILHYWSFFFFLQDHNITCCSCLYFFYRLATWWALQPFAVKCFKISSDLVICTLMFNDLTGRNQLLDRDVETSIQKKPCEKLTKSSGLIMET